MIHHATVILRCLVFAMLLCGCANAQQIPAAENGPRIVNSSYSNGLLEMREEPSGAPILLQRNRKLHVVNPEHNTIAPSVEHREQPNGFDLIYRYHNTTSAPRALGALEVGVFTLGDMITYQDLRFDGKATVAETRRPNAYPAWTYPNRWYSSVSVMRNNSMAVGVSLLYPALEYKHQARIEMWSPGGPSAVGEGGRGWAVQFRFDNFGRENPGSKIAWESFLQPGERRTYVVAVRVTKNPDEWVRTLTPYRDYFHALYGGVTYERDPRPVKGGTVAGGWIASGSNEFGFAGPQRRRPDLHGWKPWVDYMLQTTQGEPERVMLWAPSGVFRRAQQNNFPFQFTSNWMTNDPRGQQLRDAPAELRRIPQSGVELGLWWGRASEYMATWDTYHSEVIRIDNEQHMDAVFREIDLAAQAGATVIGLDAVFKSPFWEVYERIKMMRDRHPQLKFVTEGRSNDILHTVAPTWLDLYVTSRREVDEHGVHMVKTPLYLADFLLPGHETWVGLMHTRYENALGRPPTDQEMIRDIEHMLACGYVPVYWRSGLHNPAWRAAESWLNTVPSDLQSDEFGYAPPAEDEPETAPFEHRRAEARRRSGPAPTLGSPSNTRGEQSDPGRHIVRLGRGRVVAVPADGRIVKDFTPSEPAPPPAEDSSRKPEETSQKRETAAPVSEPQSRGSSSSSSTAAPNPR